jgi:transcriptional regulator with XRE-family HTH domain
MPAKRGPTLRAQMLGSALRRLRASAALKAEEVAVDFGKDQSTISRMELGTSPPHEEDVVKLMNIYGLDDDSERQAMLRLARDVYRRGWYDAYGDLFSAPMIEYSWLESRAVSIRAFGAIIVPGLLQTSDYIRALNDAILVSEVERERGVEARLLRQQVLTREAPVRYEAVLDEMALRRQVGGCDAMARQLSLLIEHAQRPNVTLLVLPFEVGAHASTDGAFDLFEMPSPYPEIGCASTPAGVVYVETERLDAMTTAYDRLRSRALDVKESTAFMKAVAKELT